MGEAVFNKVFTGTEVPWFFSEKVSAVRLVI
jgi:hypothetical protein